MKNILAALLAAVMLLSLVSFATAEGIQTIEAGKLTISTSPDFPPFEYTDDNEKIVGLILEAFDLKTAEELRSVCFKSDGSKHYGYLCPK